MAPSLPNLRLYRATVVQPEACGVCRSDSFAVVGVFQNPFPAIPGHEVIGKVRPRPQKNLLLREGGAFWLTDKLVVPLRHRT